MLAYLRLDRSSGRSGCSPKGLCLLFIGVLTGGVAPVQALSLTSGLEAYYALEGNLLDGSGHGQHAVDVGGVGYAVDRHGVAGAALSVAGGSHAQTPLDSATTQTWALWLKSEVTGQYVFGPANGNFHTHHLGIRADGQLFYEHYRNGVGGYVTLNGSAVNDGQWHYVAIVRDDATKNLKLYQNGLLLADYTETNPGFTSWSFGLNVALGRIFDWDLNTTYTGMLDDVAMWNRSLSGAEIQQYGTGLFSVPEGGANASMLAAGLMGIALLARRGAKTI